MKNLRGVLLLVMVSAVALIGLYIGDATFNEYRVFAPLKTQSSSVTITTKQQEQTDDTSSKRKTEESSQKGESSTEPVTAAAAGNVLGAIKEQYISPYNSGSSYNNVFVKNKTSLIINLKEELEAALSFSIAKAAGPQVLIVHTHTTEAYMSEERDYYTDVDYSRSTDENLNMIAVGEVFTQQLANSGIEVIHDKTMHDYPSYSGSYTRSAETINSYLGKYPSIKVVLDIHRDAIAINATDKSKPTAKINDRKAAQVMLVMGCQDGKVTGFENWRQNFRLAVKYQQTMEVMYPGLARGMVLAPKKYNENLTKGSMLLEIGTDANTFEEAKYSAELSGAALAALLNTLQ